MSNGLFCVGLLALVAIIVRATKIATSSARKQAASGPAEQTADGRVLRVVCICVFSRRQLKTIPREQFALLWGLFYYALLSMLGDATSGAVWPH